MEHSAKLFLQAVNAALNNETVRWEQDVSHEDWEQILNLAEIHRMLPMVFQAVYACPAAKNANPELFRLYRSKAMQMMVVQTRKTAEFMPLLAALRAAGVEPLVVKGIICRRLYPNPDHRLSSDEDVLIPPEQFSLCHKVLMENGLISENSQSESYEVSYRSIRGASYLEIHRSLFPEESKAYGDLNRFFRDIRSRAVEIDGVPTMCPTDHMLFLILHAFKHFIHSGFGLRQVCDMMLFANRFGSQIDWADILVKCRELRAEQFAAGLFRIGWKYLNFSLENSRYPLQWQAIYLDEEPLLEDILRSGVYGGSDMSRKHSSTITLNAVSSQKQGSWQGSGVLKSIFPSARDLESRYPYLKTKPLLLPVAWTDRIIRYSQETAANNRPEDSIRIGNERIALLRRYGVLDQK